MYLSNRGKAKVGEFYELISVCASLQIIKAIGYERQQGMHELDFFLIVPLHFTRFIDFPSKLRFNLEKLVIQLFP